MIARGDVVRVRLGNADAGDHRGDPIGELGAAKGSCRGADHGDADLHRGEEALGMAPQRQHRLCAATAALDELQQTRLP